LSEYFTVLILVIFFPFIQKERQFTSCLVLFCAGTELMGGFNGFVLVKNAIVLIGLIAIYSRGAEVYFCPGDNPTGAIVRELGTAKSNILVQAYSFTSAPIAKALVDAHRRGVKVTVILDKSQRSEKYSSADFLINAGVPTFIDASHAIAHNKVMVLDRKKIITGSFNFTKSAEERNAENLIVFDDPKIAFKYMTNWQAHASHSARYQKREIGYSERKR
jgi:phosphatidylserine/phosphatidylglycerophosphate/cardiolipin synthase-like enzyme